MPAAVTWGDCGGGQQPALQASPLWPLWRRHTNPNTCCCCGLWGVAAGTQEGAQLCLPGAGVAKTNTLGQGDMKSLEQQYGSHFFTVSIRVPSGEAATPAEQEVMTQLAQVYRRSRSGSTGALAS
jgi:hypothetical protein